jgi:hypothetical protein
MFFDSALIMLLSVSGSSSIPPPMLLLLLLLSVDLVVACSRAELDGLVGLTLFTVGLLPLGAIGLAVLVELLLSEPVGLGFSFSLLSGGLVELFVGVGAGGFVAVLVLFPLEVFAALEVAATDGLLAELAGLLFSVLVGCFGAV